MTNSVQPLSDWSRWRLASQGPDSPGESSSQRPTHASQVSAKVTPQEDAQEEETILNKEFVPLIYFPIFFILKVIVTMELNCLPGQIKMSYQTFGIRGIRRNSEKII